MIMLSGWLGHYSITSMAFIMSSVIYKDDLLFLALVDRERDVGERNV
jgi:hypothetical protein